MKEALDDLSKALAGGMSRREALRRFGVAALGAAVAVLWPGRAGAAARSYCDEYCEYLYGKYTQAAKACLRDAQHFKGPCFESGPKSQDCAHVKCPPGSFCMSLVVNHTNGSNGLGGGSTTCVPF